MKVKPSAFGLVNWKVKTLAKFWTLTRVVQKALATSLVVVVSVVQTALTQSCVAVELHACAREAGTKVDRGCDASSGRL